MRNLYQLKTVFSFKTAFIAIFLMLTNGQLFAEGSRTLYPVVSTQTGVVASYRAYLRSSVIADTERWPFPNYGTHYVYAKAGERIAMASSAQAATTSSAIRLYNPLGTEVVNDATVAGQITNRTAELAGPRYSGDTTSAGYTPLYYLVPTGGDGIYRVEFQGRGTDAPGTTYLADSEWVQGSDAGILAWDVSVINNTNNGFILGRVYVNIFNLSNGTGNPQDNGFRGIVYGLTDDGYTYRVNNNGNNGLYFSFFINNNGFTETNGVSKYKSLNKTNLTATDVHNPLNADTTTQVTHKIFYNLPDSNLPPTSIGAVPGGSTWLKKMPILPVVTNLKIKGVEGVEGQISSKGGYIQFDSNRPAKYTIIIKSGTTPAAFSERVLLGFVSKDANSILWDGKDGSGLPLPAGVSPTSITVQLQGAEVHFPYIDMEYNKNGTIIELLNKDNLSEVISDLVYWNDVDIPNATATTSGNNAPGGRYSDPKINTHLPPTNSTGITSLTKGHIWGQGATGTGGQFGDLRSMDTWAFVKGPANTLPFSINTRIADLKISQLVADKTSLVMGDQLTLIVKVKNDGPSEVTASKFTLIIPTGFLPQNAVFSGKNCGTEGLGISYDPLTKTYSSNLNLPSGCEVAYTITLVVANTILTGSQNFQAGILRPNDVSDPDATNPNPSIPPTNAQAECANNGLGGTCNNLRTIAISYTPAAVCTEQVLGETFSATGGGSKTFTQPPTNNGFVFDIYTLDNSFNMTINNTKIALSEIEFQTANTPAPGINIRFADGDQYVTNTPNIYEMNGSAATPLIRVVISPTGAISMYGSKISNGPLFPLELFNNNTFNNITWNTSTNNTIIISQNVVLTTFVTGRGYGVNIVPCVCYDAANTLNAGLPSKHGISLLQRAGANNGNWPASRLGAHTVLESNSKGFVVTRLATADLAAITTPVDGMMVYDTTVKCLKIYTIDTAIPANTGWKCFSSPACP